MTSISVHIVDTLDSISGGPARSVTGLVRSLGSHSKIITRRGDVSFEGIFVVESRSFVNLIQSLEREHQSGSGLILHLHGVWSPFVAVAALWALLRQVPFVWAPRGMLEPWALRHRGFKKKLAWWTYQRWLFERSRFAHVTSEAEAENIQALCPLLPVCISPNGVSIPETTQVKNEKPYKEVLFLSRIHPKKGLARLIRSFAVVRPDGWRLRVVGPNEEGYLSEMKALVAELNVGDLVFFRGAVDDTEKWNVYAAADLFVLPTFSENFGIVIAEALAAGLPVITTIGAPWEILKIERCGWWIGHEQCELENALKEAVSIPKRELKEMGRRGQDFTRQRLTWSIVSKKLCLGYEKIRQQEKKCRLLCL